MSEKVLFYIAILLVILNLLFVFVQMKIQKDYYHSIENLRGLLSSYGFINE